MIILYFVLYLDMYHQQGLTPHQTTSDKSGSFFFFKNQESRMQHYETAVQSSDRAMRVCMWTCTPFFIFACDILLRWSAAEAGSHACTNASTQAGSMHAASSRTFFTPPPPPLTHTHFFFYLNVLTFFKARRSIYLSSPYSWYWNTCTSV